METKRRSVPVGVDQRQSGERGAVRLDRAGKPWRADGIDGVTDNVLGRVLAIVRTIGEPDVDQFAVEGQPGRRHLASDISAAPWLATKPARRCESQPMAMDGGTETTRRGAECIAAQFARDTADFLEGHGQPWQHFHAGLGEDNLAVDPVKQLAPHLFLDGADELADGGSRDRKLFRGRRKAACARRGLEGLKSFQGWEM